MLILRSILLVIFGLLFIGVLFGTIHSTTPTTEADWSILGLFSVIIALLGPLWPTKEKLENSRFNLPTDNPKIAAPLFMFVLGLVSFYFAVNEWLSPSQSHSRMAQTVYSLFGSSGVVVFWAFLGVLCLVGAYRAYRKFKTA